MLATDIAQHWIRITVADAAEVESIRFVSFQILTLFVLCSDVRANRCANRQKCVCEWNGLNRKKNIHTTNATCTRARARARARQWILLLFYCSFCFFVFNRQALDKTTIKCWWFLHAWMYGHADCIAVCLCEVNWTHKDTAKRRPTKKP